MLPVAIAAKRAAKAAVAKRVKEKAGVSRLSGRWVLRAGLAVLPMGMFGIVLLGSVGGALQPAHAGSCGVGVGVPSSADIPPSTQAGINSLKSMYETVGEEENLAWSLLAAVDYRENGNDPGRSMLSGEPIGTTNPDSGVVASSKRDSVIRGARHLRVMAKSVYDVDLTASSGGADIQMAVLAYNRGSIYKRAGAAPTTSPYVMNQYDAAHADMTWPNVSGEPLAGQVEHGRFGAFTIFTRLGGSSASCGLSDVEIVRIAQGQLGLHETPDGCNCGEQIQKFLGSSAGEQWCADFVSWVYREAGHPFSGGADGGWRVYNVGTMHDFIAGHGVWMPGGSADDPRPGDVITFRDDGHVGLVESLDDGGTPGKPDDDTVHTIEGNTSNMVARRDYRRSGGEITGWGRQAA